MRVFIRNLSSIYIPYRILAERAKYTEFARFPKESLRAESPNWAGLRFTTQKAASNEAADQDKDGI